MLVLGGDLECNFAAFDRRHRRGDLDRHAGQRRRQVPDRYVDADRVLAGVGVLEDQVAAGCSMSCTRRGVA